MPDQLGVHQLVALDDELRLAAGFVDHGLVALGRLDGGNDHRQLPMHLLSMGLERLVKATIAVCSFEQHGTLPRPDQMKSMGHDLQVLTTHLIELVQGVATYTSRAACADDLRFLADDTDLQALLRALTAYGRQGRYHNLDAILGRSGLGDSPDDLWQEIERACLDALPHWIEKLGKGAEFGGFYEEMASRLTATLQRFTRGICRMWTLGPLGDLGRRYQGPLHPFLMLRDQDLAVVRRMPSS